MSRNNLFPVFQKAIDLHAGIEITGKFKTNDTVGKMSYVTVRRNSSIAAPHDGFGLAWRIGDGTKYNVYIVDNNILSEDVYVGNENVIDSSGSVNQFLKAAKMIIVANTWYSFRIKISIYNAVEVWIYPSSSSEGERILYKGQTYPEYIPAAYGEHFGVGVLGTENQYWYYKDLEIVNIAEIFPSHLFRLKAQQDKFLTSSEFSLTYYGVGWGESESPSLKWYIKNLSTDDWDLCGENDEHGINNTDSFDEKKMTKLFANIDDYRDSSNFINVLVRPENYLEEEHKLRSYYIGAHNSILSGMHTGNMMDIYVVDRGNILVKTTSAIVLDNKIELDISPGFTFPILDIIDIYTSISEITLEEGNDYVVTRTVSSLSFSTRDKITITFKEDLYEDISMNIVYRYYSDGENLQEYIESSEYRYPGSDNLIKTKAPCIIEINKLDYKGNIGATELTTEIINYINTLSSDTFEISDLINLCYLKGATSVNLKTLDISVKDYSYLGTYVRRDVSNYYELTDGFKMFFADNTSVVGVTNVN